MNIDTLPKLYDLVYRHWLGLRRGDSIPLRRDLDPLEFFSALPNVMIMDVKHDPLRLEVRLAGSALTERWGRETRGKYIDEMLPPEQWQAAEAGLREMLANPEPNLAERRFVAPDGREFHSTRLLMPLSSNGTTVDHVLGVFTFDEVKRA
jgi:hypothetical protein